MELTKQVECQGKFVRLSKYFDQITYQDLKQFEEHELTKMADPMDKPLMKIFCQNLKKYFYRYEMEGKIVEKDQLPTDGNFRGVICSVSMVDGGCTLRDLLTHPFECETLDLSSNGLFDDDLDLLHELVKQKKPKVLNLAHNYFHGLTVYGKHEFDEKIISILDSVELLIVYGNNFASADRKDLFDKFTKEHYNKLIWIPIQFYTYDTWKSMVPPEYADMVKELHEKYYKENPLTLPKAVRRRRMKDFVDADE